MLMLQHLAKRLGTEVIGTTIDFTDWFLQFAIEKKDYLKAGIVSRDGIRIDRRLQMGRKYSALHGKQLSFLIGELVEREAEAQEWGLRGLGNEQKEIIEEWQRSRRHLGPRQQRIVKVGPFQDDHVILTLNTKAGRHILSECRRFMKNTLRVELSPKPEANKPFAVHFSAIGASYDTRAEDGIAMKPNETILQKFAANNKDARSYIGKLVPIQKAQSWMGLAQFVQQFVEDGRFHLNSGYLAIKASGYIRTRTPQVSIGEWLVAELEQLQQKVNLRSALHLPDAQFVWDAGAAGPFVDTTAPT